MRKLAKIESPSEDEKKHISEEEMYIDQPVVDNIKNNKILNKRRDRNMSYYDNAYEGLVSEAYENILDSMEKDAYEYEDGYEKMAKKKGGDGYVHPGKKALAYKYDPHFENGSASFNARPAVDGAPSRKQPMLIDTRKFGRKALDHLSAHKGAYGGAATALAAAAATPAILKALKGRKHEEEAAEEAAEKAAAYYDEAQLIKEAAENDYETACAYEEAALQILDELGYLD